jgi:pteridine reductase
MARPESPVALVTGAGVRLGRAVSEGLATRGFDLVLHANRSRRQAGALARQFRAQGRRATVLTADLSRSPAVQRLARQAWDAFGRVDLLVNNAGVFWPTPLERLNAAELDAFLAVNLKTPYLLSAELGRRMKARGHGVIIVLACLSALRPWKEYVPYSISKAGVVALTVGLAKLLAPEVRVNAIAPGPLLLPVGAAAAHRRMVLKKVPLRRMGRPEDLVRAVIYLWDASFVTGQVLCVDGGASVT